MRQLLHIVILLSLALISITVPHGSKCPCKDAAIEIEHYQSDRNANLSSGALVLCIANARTTQRELLRRIVLPGIDIQFVHNFSTECNVLMRIEHSSNADHNSSGTRHLCPGICRPIPEIRIMSKWLEMDVVSMIQNPLLSCTLTMSMVKTISSSRNPSKLQSQVVLNDGSNLAGVSDTSLLHVADMLSTIFWRRIMECYERKIWHTRYFRQTASSAVDGYPIAAKKKGNPELVIVRRKVSSIVIWIGSNNRLKLIEEQAIVLKDFPFSDEAAVIGWAATDESYPCRDSKVKCLSKNRKCLPKSAINFMSKGWGCAQRRPLRSLAHVLLLVEPTFAIVLDDDTFLNYKLLVKKYGSYLTQGAMVQRPLAVGELLGIWGDMGQLTKWGIYAGGAGYIIGRKALEALVAYEIKYYTGEGVKSRQQDVNDSDFYRSNQQIYHLSVYREGLEMSSKHCSSSVTLGPNRIGDGSGDSCILSNKPVLSSLNSTMQNKEMKRNLVIPIAVRLIDFCANLLANENTCLHRCITIVALPSIALCNAAAMTYMALNIADVARKLTQNFISFPCSDHSLSRCFVYGAFIDPVSAACHSTAPKGNPMVDPFDPTDPTGVKIGLCFMSPICDVSEQIMCHRYKPHEHLNQAVRTNVPGYYRVYSSLFNGSVVDTFM